MSETKKQVEQTKKEVTVETVIGKTEQIIIPESMTKLAASIQLKKQWDEEETMIDLHQSFDKWDYKDVLVATMRSLKSVFGWVPGVPIHTMFGTINPKEINIPVDYIDGKQIYESCFYGDFKISQWEDAKGSMSVRHGITSISFTLKKKFAVRAKEFFVAVEQELRDHSIYKGKSLVVTKNADNYLEFDFIETKGSTNIVLNPDEERVVENLVIQPLGKSGKRCILFVGSYGTGKTETAMRVGKEANSRGITFMYCKEGAQFSNLLEKAKQYSPALVFLEDIDEIGSGEDRDSNMNDILNTLDGVQTKGNDLTVIFTTNHEKRINKALRRPGRIDLILRFDKCLPETTQKIYDSLFKGFPGVDNLDTESLALKTPVVQGAIVAEIAKRSKDIANSTFEGIISDDIVLTAITSMKDHIEFMEADPEDTKDPRIVIVDNLVNEIGQKVSELV